MKVFIVICAAFCQASALADWPTLRGEVARTGFSPERLAQQYQAAWTVELFQERLGTALEPILASNILLVATHSGNVYALDAQTAAPNWRFAGHGPFLHSPSVSGTTVVAASALGQVYALDLRDGQLRWSFQVEGGFSASPLLSDNTVFIGSRGGRFLALELSSGKPLWSVPLTAPIRQTAALSGDRVVVTSEDLQVHCFDARGGTLRWTSEQLTGQTARDYFPVIVASPEGKKRVIVRTNPIHTMSQRLGRDRTFLCRNAGVDDSGWQKVDAWIKSDQARGNPELWAKEQDAVVDYLSTNRPARNFFVLEAETGRILPHPPVLWASGCQAAGALPVLSGDGRLLVFYRSAYGNWNHGVAPLVALGLLDLDKNRIEPLFHQQGRQPAWNHFWGTADESQNFVMTGPDLLIVHQGTLSRFDLVARQLSFIHGNRDTFGGLPSPRWARNEWHGPARSGVALSKERIYWQTGSRIICLQPGNPAQKPAAVITIQGDKITPVTAPVPAPPSREHLREKLAAAVREALDINWAPLFVDPGLAGRNFSFDESADLFEAMTWAFPHLPEAMQARVKARLRAMFRDHPPHTPAGALPLKEGQRREWFWTPEDCWSRAGSDKPPHPFGNLRAAYLYARRCSEMDLLATHWNDIAARYNDFRQTGWKLDAAKGGLYANRYYSSLVAMRSLAETHGDESLRAGLDTFIKETGEALHSWWRRAAAEGTLTQFKGSAELDPFIGRGDALSFRVSPHRHEIALFNDFSPEVARLLEKDNATASKIWETFSILYKTWPFVGEERQVHFGENFVDPPNLAMGAFRFRAWMSQDDLRWLVDQPFCKADLYYITKLALALERS